MNTKSFIKKLSASVLTSAAGFLFPCWSFAAESPLTEADPKAQAIIAVQNQVTKGLMAVPEIIGTAVGLDARGELSLVIYVNERGPNTAAVIRTLPPKMRGVNVSVEKTEPFRAGGPVEPMDGGPAHKTNQTPPIQLGTSGGWRQDLANGYCCGGTLGSLIQVGGVQYILSNYHVLWADIVPGGNNRVAIAGDFAIQPGLIDVGCNANLAQNVATLSFSGSLPGANVDAGLAQVIPGQVRADGAILDVGTISATTIGPSLNQKVKKSGRTSGLTRSTVSSINATVSVAYDNECAGGPAFTKTFTGQILVKNRNKGVSFLVSGDSGSLMVQDVATNPKAIGLLFAGSSTIAVANPIGGVLSWAGGVAGGTATMVGQ